MATRRIHHVNIVMPAGGEPAARAFYGGLLGFREIPKPDEMAGRGGVWFAMGGIDLHVGVDPEFQPARKAHVAYEVTDLDGLRRRVGALGHPTRDDVPLPGYRRFHTEDPFGNRVEVLESDPAEESVAP